MEHEQKYAIATIQIPLKVSPNGKYETMLKNIHITFAPATAATIPKSNETEINGEFQNILKNMFSKVTEKERPEKERLEQERLEQEKERQEKERLEQEKERLEQERLEQERLEQEKERLEQEREPEYPILKSEILPKSGRRNLNTTFKQRPGKSRQYTAKNTDSFTISSDRDADPVE